MEVSSNAYFEDYDAFTETEIREVTPQGISLRNGMFIDFGECAAVFEREHPGSGGKCVGEREISDHSFTFYCSPRPIMIIFLTRSKLIEFLSKRNTSCRFQDLQSKIVELGYTTYDMS